MVSDSVTCSLDFYLALPNLVEYPLGLPAEDAVQLVRQFYKLLVELVEPLVPNRNLR